MPNGIDEIIEADNVKNTYNPSDIEKENDDLVESAFDKRFKENYKNYIAGTVNADLDLSDEYNKALSTITQNFVEEMATTYYITKLSLNGLKQATQTDKHTQSGTPIYPYIIRDNYSATFSKISPIDDQTIDSKKYDVRDKPPKDPSSIQFKKVQPPKFMSELTTPYLQPQVYKDITLENLKSYLSPEERDAYQHNNDVITKNQKASEKELIPSIQRVITQINHNSQNQKIDEGFIMALNILTKGLNVTNNKNKQPYIPDIIIRNKKKTNITFPTTKSQQVELYYHCYKMLDQYTARSKAEKTEFKTKYGIKYEDFEDMMTKFDIYRHNLYGVNIIVNPISTSKDPFKPNQGPRDKDPQQMIVVDLLHKKLIRYPVSTGKFGISKKLKNGKPPLKEKKKTPAITGSIAGIVDEYKDTNTNTRKKKTYNVGSHSWTCGTTEILSTNNFTTDGNVYMTGKIFILKDKWNNLKNRGIFFHGANYVSYGVPASASCIRLQPGNEENLAKIVLPGVSYKINKTTGKYERTFSQPDRDKANFDKYKNAGGTVFTIIDPSEYGYKYNSARRSFDKK